MEPTRDEHGHGTYIVNYEVEDFEKNDDWKDY
jgi:hypothetical protein